MSHKIAHEKSRKTSLEMSRLAELKKTPNRITVQCDLVVLTLYYHCAFLALKLFLHCTNTVLTLY